MMRDFKNNTLHDLTIEEHEAIIKAVKVLQDGFKKSVFQVTISPNNQERTDVYALSFAFDLTKGGYK